MEDFEKLGAFYLGRTYDLQSKKATEQLVLYDSKDLVTHAVILGMTGSGKTGLCIDLIEEAAIDNIPSIVIDPKGDLTNLLLTFPQLRGQDFLPWINVEEASKKSLSPEEYANQQAELWTKGLAEWGQTPERIQRLCDAAQFLIYTPASNAGIPVSILKSFAAPGPAVLEDGELVRERVSTIATSLLTLLGIQADPIQSREHILLSTILHNAWKQGQDLDLTMLIRQIQTPPVTQIGVLDLESFYPAKDRFGLVMALNNLLAAPGFNAWLEGVALDIGQILYTPQGKPRVAVFSIAHLSDAERMFFVSLLLNQVLSWMRAQSGTTSLRAILYMDEIFGYFPPVANPPSKLPFLTLLKQARAFGLGVVLATQNPVDLDYKGLSNAGTWFIGRLQTERDMDRVLDGLEGVAAGSGTGFDRQRMTQIIPSLGNRVFLMNNVHEDAPQILQSRWALSYLRGPLTREQIKRLMDPIKGVVPSEPAPVSAPVSAAALAQPVPFAPAPAAAAPVAAPEGTARREPPALPADVAQFFIPIRGSSPVGTSLAYLPRIIGMAKVRFTDTKTRVDVPQAMAFITPITDEAVPVSWEKAREINIASSDLERSSGQADFAPVPASAMQAKSYANWSRDFVTWLYGSQKLDLLRSPSFGQISNPGESERDFRVRLQQAAREQRDQALEEIQKRYAPKLVSLQDKIRRAEQAGSREEAQAKQQDMQTAISFGATLLSAVIGKKAASLSSLGRATTAVRGVGRSMKERQDIDRAAETVEVLQQQYADLEAELKSETEALATRIDASTENLEVVTIRPKKTDIAVQIVSLVWEPNWQGAQREMTAAWV